MTTNNEAPKKKGKHGGARPGAGRKPKDTHGVKIRLSPEHHEKLKALGGSKWIRKQIEEAPLP